MADEFEGRVCGEMSWWNSSKTMFDVEGGFGWADDNLFDMKIRSSPESAASASDDSVPHQQDTENGNYNISMDSTQQVMNNGFPISTTTSDWNQSLFQNNGKFESNYSSRQQDLNPKHYAISEDYSINTFKQDNQCFALEMINSQQTLFDSNPQPQKSSFIDNQSTNYVTSFNDFSPPLPILSPMLKASLPKQQSPITHFPFSNNTSSWNAALNEIRASLLPSTDNEKLKLPNLTIKANKEVTKKINDEPAPKRTRIETPSPLPTFKVRKEKMGDRITALQQLVSPFGKNDTASVLHEAVEYIKFLHDQVNVLSTPNLGKNGQSNIQSQQTGNKHMGQDGLTKDLKSRGLCLVPISSTFPIAAETTTDFWTPTFEAALNGQTGEAIQLLRTQLMSY